jgi:hypothetical protein
MCSYNTKAYKGLHYHQISHDISAAESSAADANSSPQLSSAENLMTAREQFFEEPESEGDSIDAFEVSTSGEAPSTQASHTAKPFQGPITKEIHMWGALTYLILQAKYTRVSMGSFVDKYCDKDEAAQYKGVSGQVLRDRVLDVQKNWYYTHQQSIYCVSNQACRSKASSSDVGR